jgi:hypothetical protein
VIEPGALSKLDADISEAKRHLASAAAELDRRLSRLGLKG